MSHPILEALGQTQVLQHYRPDVETIIVQIDGKLVGSIVPGRPGYHEMAYSRAGTSAGPAFDRDQLRRRLAHLWCGGDLAALDRAIVGRFGKNS